MKHSDLVVDEQIKHVDEKMPYKIIAVNDGVAIATRKLFGRLQYVVLDANKNTCGHSTLMNFPRGIKGREGFEEELIGYHLNEWKISTRGQGKLDKCWEVFSK